MKARVRPIKTISVGYQRNKYEVEVVHDGLGVEHLVKATEMHLLNERIEKKMNQLNKSWEKLLKNKNQQDKISIAELQTEKAQKDQQEMGLILKKCNLSEKNPKFSMLNKPLYFSKQSPDKPNYPVEPEYSDLPIEPQRSNFNSKQGCGCLGFLFSTKKVDEANYLKAHAKWNEELAFAKKENKITKDHFNKKLSVLKTKYNLERDNWLEQKDAFEFKAMEFNNSVKKLTRDYRNKNAKSIGDLFKTILNNCDLPQWIPRLNRTLFNLENGILVIEGLLPNQDQMPTLSAVRYIKTRDELVEKHIAVSAQNTLYDKVLYQIVLRAVYEVFRWDLNKYVKAVVYNGSVKGVDKATGKQINPCILSIQASRDEFEGLNLDSVDPKACFKKLKGVSSSKLFSLVPVAPVLRIDKGDRRFVEGRKVVDGVSIGDNLAAMNWEDFEHLIRELFEKEFVASGGEVKVTQASRDGGVDAIVFDPDPIRGGKIVIQAKRYTNTVGVSAVRDLYGTLMNEGANKGILVSTSDYGPDAYKFAKGKPLLLLNGGELLYLLEKHGHTARIDIKEAKIILAEQEKEKMRKK